MVEVVLFKVGLAGARYHSFRGQSCFQPKPKGQAVALLAHLRSRLSIQAHVIEMDAAIAAVQKL